MATSIKTSTGRSNAFIKPYRSKLSLLLRLSDSFFVCATLWVVTYFRAVEWQLVYSMLAVAGLLFYSFFAEYKEIYYEWRLVPMSEKALDIAFSWFSAASILVFVAFATEVDDSVSPPVVGAWVILVPLVLVLCHSVSKVVPGYLTNKSGSERKVAIVGATDLGNRLAQAFAQMPWLGYRNVGYYDDRMSMKDRRQDYERFQGKNKRLSHERRSDGVRASGVEPMLIGDFDLLYEHARDRKIEIIYITLALCAEKRVEMLIDRLADTTVSVYFIPDLFVFNLLHSRWTMVHGIPVISVYDTPLHSSDGLVKRLEDIVFSSLILMIIAIPMVIIALGIKLTSPGPVLFKQKRYGVSGETIEVWKFRTMTVCEDGPDLKQATRNDPRVTRFGAFLRRTSLDELPQFINVLQGTMSVVGPRPHAVAHNELYRKHVHGYMLRHKVKPGITGLAQVNGYRGEIKTDDMLEMRILHDLEYIRSWSLALDFKILLLTVFKGGFVSEQAY